MRNEAGTSPITDGKATASGPSSDIYMQMMSFLEILPDGYALFDADERLVAITRAFMHVCELPELPEIGTFIEDMLSEAANRIIWDITRGNEEEWVRSHLAQIRSSGREREVQLRSGRWLRLVDRRLDDGFTLCVRTDITALKTSAQRLRQAMDASMSALVIINAAGIIEDFNPAAEAIFGYKRDQVIGAVMKELLIPERYRQAHEDGIQRYLQTGKAKILDKRIEIEAMRADGSEFLAELTINHGADPTGPIFFGSVRDITKRKRSENALIAAKEKAEHANRAQADFLAMMSHEIRTPLNGLLGILSLLKDNDLTNEQLSYVRIGERSGQGLLRIINDILDYSKIESGEFSFHAVPFDLNDLVAGVIDIISPNAQEKGLTLDFSIDSDERIYLEGDEERLRQILVNLAGNAVKFTDEGSVTIRVHPDHAGPQKVHLFFSVIDTGIGIDDGKASDLFKKFSTASPSYQQREGGTGLGLAICKTLVTAMGGKIGVQSNPSGGCTFWFTVTLDASNEKIVNASDESLTDRSHILAATDGEKLKILIAEDNTTNALIARVMLQDAGYEIHVVGDGEQAVEAVMGENFDLVLMDIGMPGVDGVEAAARIRKLPGRKANIPIIALTAHVLKDQRMYTMMRDMDDYIAKPIQREAMLVTVANWALGLRTRTAYIQQTEDPRTDHAQIEAGSPAPPDPDTEDRQTAHARINTGPHPPRQKLRTPGAMDYSCRKLLDGQALKRLSDDTSPEIVTELISDFLHHSRERLDAMCQAVRSASITGDTADLCLHAHALSSSAATFGALRLHALTRDIEAACIEGEREVALALGDLIDPIGSASLQVLERVRQIAREQTAAAKLA